jgi:hypothetical protein
VEVSTNTAFIRHPISPERVRGIHALDRIEAGSNGFVVVEERAAETAVEVLQFAVRERLCRLEQACRFLQRQFLGDSSHGFRDFTIYTRGPVIRGNKVASATSSQARALRACA